MNPAALLPSIRITQTWLLTIVDILLVWYVLYRVILLAKGRRAWPILIGLGIFFLLLLTAERIGLITLAWILRQFVPLGPVAIVILFYPELRDVLERLGRWEFWVETMFRPKRQNPLRLSTMSLRQQVCSRLEKPVH